MNEESLTRTRALEYSVCVFSIRGHALLYHICNRDCAAPYKQVAETRRVSTLQVLHTATDSLHHS